MFGMKRLRERVATLFDALWETDKRLSDLEHKSRYVEAETGANRKSIVALERRIPVPCTVCGKMIVPSDETRINIWSIGGVEPYEIRHVHHACRKGTQYDLRAKKRKKGE